MSVFRFIKAIVEDQPVTLYGDGGERDFTHVDDVVRGVIGGLVPLGYRIINIGSGRPVRVRELISMIEQMAGREARIKVRPRPAADADVTLADTSEAKRLLSWEPQVALQTGIEETLKWYVDNRSWAVNID